MDNIKTTPRQIFQPHPILGWKLTPNQKVYVKFRDNVVQTTDSEGWRTVVNSPDTPQATVGVYGCSYTYGTGLLDSETYTSLLQKQFQQIKFLNRGVGGHGNVQGYLQFRQDVKQGKVNAAIFSMISDHRYRNVSHPSRMKAHLSFDWYKIGVEHVPRAQFNRNGEIIIEYIPIWQPSLFHSNYETFLADAYTLDRITIGLFKEIITFAGKHEIPIIIALLDQVDPEFNEIMRKEVKNCIDISTPFNGKYIFLPDDTHPNPVANCLFSERLKPWVRQTFPNFC